MSTLISDRTNKLLDQTVLWDNHACMPLRAEDETFLPQLARYKAAGVSLVSLNVTFDIYPSETAFAVLASFRHWIAKHADDYVLADTVADVEAAKLDGKLAVVFDIEGGKAVEPHPGLVEVFYRLGVRWTLTTRTIA
jgi:membrane dipeptidase